LRPQQIRIVTASAGDSVESLAGRMMVDKAPLEQFRAINALQAGERITPGRKYKLIVR